MSKQYAPAGKEYDMENKEKYIRVGTTLYKIVRRPLISGDYIEEKILWSYEVYILIRKYPTFQSKSIPLTNLNGTTSFITNDKYVYKTGDYN